MRMFFCKENGAKRTLLRRGGESSLSERPNYIELLIIVVPRKSPKYSTYEGDALSRINKIVLED